MATLISPHWETITPTMKDVLQTIGMQSFSQRFYLAGGTALSLQFGHRRSVDLDFFSEVDEVDEASRNEITLALKLRSPQVLETAGGNLLMLISDVRVGFFGYGYPLIDEIVKVENIALASLADIGLMKCDAVVSRGSRKDFYDLFYIAMQIPLAQLLELSKTKYPLFRDFPLLLLESMILFDQADRDIQPDLIDYLPWEEIKRFFIQQSRLLSQDWFNE